MRAARLFFCKDVLWRARIRQWGRAVCCEDEICISNDAAIPTIAGFCQATENASASFYIDRWKARRTCSPSFCYDQGHPVALVSIGQVRVAVSQKRCRWGKFLQGRDLEYVLDPENGYTEMVIRRGWGGKSSVHVSDGNRTVRPDAVHSF